MDGTNANQATAAPASQAGSVIPGMVHPTNATATMPAPTSAAATDGAAMHEAEARAPAPPQRSEDDSDDDLPLMARANQNQPARPSNGAKPRDDDDSDDDLPLMARANQNQPARPSNGAKPRDDDDDSDDDLPLVARKKPAARPSNGATPRSKPAPKRKAPEASSTPKRARTSTGNDDKPIKWNTLEHAGVLFPPEYEPLPNDLKMLYDGKPVELTAEQEEVAQLFAVMKDTDYMQKPTFIKNFWEDFRGVLGPKHVIQKLELCDFTPFYEHAMKLREEKKNKTKQEKEADKKEKDAKEAKFKFAMVDGRKEQVGNFRVEPPGLFRGRGEHPKMGKLKKRIYPRDITINIGEGVAVPEHPYPGQTWKEIRHDHTVTWLAFWKDPINTKEYKYVWLAANSSFKTDSDLAKYEKARKLKDYIGDIRKTYEADWESRSSDRRQMAVALYFIDKLALRAGHEKDDDEADTVGCCTLKCENVEVLEGSTIRFDFLGKDSIRYENEVDVDPKVYRAVREFKARFPDGSAKRGEDQLFDAFDATALNNHLKGLMDGLSVKVFRTYNASITLDRLLWEPNGVSETVEQRKADYDRANKEVAVLCNHQRSVPKGHQTSMAKMDQRIADVEGEIAELKSQLVALQKGTYKAPEGKKAPNIDAVAKKVERKQQQLQKLHLQKTVKDDLKTVALGTSKINYMDPRISVAWCKRSEVPIEKVFNKSLLSKFLWAMEVEPDFKF